MTRAGFRLKSDRCHSPFSWPLNNVAAVIFVADYSLNKTRPSWLGHSHVYDRRETGKVEENSFFIFSNDHH